MTRERLTLFDTTLRDGAQTQGVDFSAADKAAIAVDLDRLGVDYVEAGWPGANPTDDAFFALFGAIPMVQVNQSFAQVKVVTGLSNGWAYGVFLAGAVALVTLRGLGYLLKAQ